MKKSTSNILMIVGFLVIIVSATMLFAKKTEAFQNVTMPQFSFMAPMPSMPQFSFMGPTPSMPRMPMAPMPSMPRMPIMAPMPSMPMAPTAPMPRMPVMGPMPSMPVKPVLPPFPSMGAPTPMMGTPRISEEVLNRQMQQIQRIDTSLIGMTRSFGEGIKFFKNLLNERRTIEQNLIRMGKQPPTLPKEVYNFLLTMKL